MKNYELEYYHWIYMKIQEIFQRKVKYLVYLKLLWYAILCSQKYTLNNSLKLGTIIRENINRIKDLNLILSYTNFILYYLMLEHLDNVQLFIIPS